MALDVGQRHEPPPPGKGFSEIAQVFDKRLSPAYFVVPRHTAFT
jgi:hypothetical protein